MLIFAFFKKDSRDNRLNRTIIIDTEPCTHIRAAREQDSLNGHQMATQSVLKSRQLEKNVAFALTILSLYAQTLNIRNYTIILQENNL